MTTKFSKLGATPEVAALTAAVLGVACASKTANLGDDPDASLAPASFAPTLARTAPPATAGALPAATPWKLVEGGIGIRTFGVGQGEVFWLDFILEQTGDRSIESTGIALNRCNVDDCAGTIERWRVGDDGWQVSSNDPALLPPIELTSEFACWRNSRNSSSGIDCCSRDDCASPINVNPDSAVAWTYALDGPDLFLAGTGMLFRCSAENCNATLVAVPVPAPDGVAPLGHTTRIVADQDYLYTVPYDDYRILRLSKDGSEPFQVIAEGEAFVGDIALSADSVLWTEQVALGTIKACPKTGCAGAPRILASGLHGPQSLAVDAERVYFTEPRVTYEALCPASNVASSCLARVPGSDRLSSCALSGCSAPTVLVENAGIGGRVLVDDRFVYVLGSDPNYEPVAPAFSFIAVLPK